ncbi:pre-mRNA-processing factor 31 [Syncephalastrum racemosum]|uniref:Pre-mRNA-processing factor 31 n=1 Tax=Syncephalastrum racemosum TaxID=13706 RepID=A0A1X2H5L9_SYNRA|nr:pre-mRNA-processing factor 31 [Syncephalastrum racemosum]
MSSLADELAADLDISDDENHSDEEQDQQDTSNYMDADDDDNNGTEKEREATQTNTTDGKLRINQVSTLLGMPVVKSMLERIDYYTNQDRDGVSRPLTENDDEYQLIVNSNSLTTDIDDELQLVHKFIRDHYEPRFPELERLILNPLDYARTVKAIGNETDIAKIDLSFLPSATVMVISVTQSTTVGKPLPEEELEMTFEACDMARALDDARHKIMSYVESRMSVIAPNLSHVTDPSTAAKLLTAAGGLQAFCKIPACNVQVLGRDRKINIGLSRASQEKHTGYIYSSNLALSVPPDLRRKVVKIVAAKAVLAARIDAGHGSPQGEMGRQMRDEIDQKIEKLREPPPSKKTKALPIPDEGPKKRRGGKRVRRQKEAYTMTELRAARNRMAFGEAEEEVGYGDETEGLGMAAKQTGKIRAAVADPRNKVRAPKNRSFNMPGTRTAGSTSGLATSLAFTPVQGIELADPNAAAERVKKANEKWFGDGAFSIVPK